VDSLLATVKLSSVLGARIGFHNLTLNHPVVHIIFYPDGTSNVPLPEQKNQANDFEHLLSVSIARLGVQRGEILYQDQLLPLDFSSNDISANVYYSFLRRRYSGNLAVGKAETIFNGYRPVAWSGRAGFAADRNGIELKSVEANSGATKLQLDGWITNWRAPLVKGNYDLRIDLAQAASVARQRQLKGGTLAVNGVGSWSAQMFSSDGKFDLQGLAWQDSNLVARDVSASAKFAIDPQKLSISQAEGELVHGRFVADAEVSNWQSRVKQAGAKNAQAGIVKVKFRDLSLAEVLASLGPAFRPFNRLKFAGNVSGTTDLRWRWSVENAEATFALDVTRPNRLQPWQIPVTGSTHAN